MIESSRGAAGDEESIVQLNKRSSQGEYFPDPKASRELAEHSNKIPLNPPFMEGGNNEFFPLAEWRQRGFVKNLGSMAIALIRSLALKG